MTDPTRTPSPPPSPQPVASELSAPEAASALEPIGTDEAAAGDPFPRQAWSTLLGHAAGYLKLTVALLKDPAVSKHRRAALLAAAAYFASPIDLVPGIVPVLGQLDDLAVAMLAIRLALNALEPTRRQAHLAAAGLSDDTLREDIEAAGAIGAWTARAGARMGLRVGRMTLRAGARGGRALAAGLARGGRAVVDRAANSGGPAGAVTDRAARVATAAGDRAAQVARSAGEGPLGRIAGGATDRAGAAAGRAGETGRRLAARIRRQEGAPPLDAEAPDHPTD